VISPWVLGIWQVFWLLIASIWAMPTSEPELESTAGELIFLAVVLALNGLGAALGYQLSRRPRQLRSATKRGYVYLALAVLDLVLIIVLLVLAASAGGPQPEPQTTGKAETAASRTPGSRFPASAEELADALLVPADLGDLGWSTSVGPMVVRDQERGRGADVTGSGITHDISYVSGDRACKAVVEEHPVVPEAWAWVGMANSSKPAEATVEVYEDIESFASEAHAQRVMQQTRDQLVDCREFIGETDGLRMTYKHQNISVPLLGEETVAHQIDGEAKDGTFFVWNFVQIHSGRDVLFINYSPAERGEVHTVKIAAAAWDKYSRVR
jgi:hypothetical protein